MRICLYTHTALPLIGGQEIAVDALARQFQRQGHEVAVLAPRPSRHWRLPDRDLPYPVFRHPRFVSLRHLISWYRWWLLRLHRRFRFDIIHAQGIYPAGYLAARALDGAPCPLVITSQGEDVPASSHLLPEPRLYQRHTQALKRANALVAISNFTREGLLELCPEAADRILWLPNGVDVAALAAPAPRPAGLDPAIVPNEYVLFLGRLHPRKGVDGLLQALSRIPSTQHVQLVIAGDGKERPRLERFAAELHLQERVRFVGTALGELKAYLLQNALCLAAPSVGWEGQGIVVLEGYAAGRPVIVSQLPGFADLVRPGETGWTVPPSSPSALARVLAEVFADRAELTRRGERARELAQQYSWEAVARRHLGLYRDLLTANRVAHSA